MFTDEVQDVLKSATGTELTVRRLIPLYGGDINQVYRIESSKGEFCIKLNNDSSLPDLFVREAEGLKMLARSKFKVPEVIATGHFGSRSYLIMEFLPKGVMKENFWEDFGIKLAGLHTITSDRFGLGNDNYIATLTQSNKQKITWSSFYYSERLLPLVKLGIRRGLMTDRDLADLEKFADLLAQLVPEEKPALLHGDLWSGNYLVGADGSPVLIDPAVYYGHREMDLAMTLLFGGFDDKMYEAYNSIYPLEPNWRERMKIGKLYPLLVHVNLFGGHYINQYRSIMQRFV